MDLLIWLPMIVSVVALVLAVLAIVKLPTRERLPDPDPETTAAIKAVRANLPPVPARAPHKAGNPVVTEAPMIDGVTLREWLINTNPLADGIWPQVVRDFYRAAAENPAVADYFRNTDMERLQQHFCRALSMVAGNGLRMNTIFRLREIHRTVLSSDGMPITAEVYDAVINTLVEVLTKHGVPPRGIQALARTIAPLRAELVRA